jgi:2-oxoglutarate ferredoxin oxidoreductase subunit beta
MEKSLIWGDEIPIGKFFQRTDLPSLHASEPVLTAGTLVRAELGLPADMARAFIAELM